MASAGVAQEQSPAAAGRDPNVGVPIQPRPSDAAVDEAWTSLIAIVDGFPGSLGPCDTRDDPPSRAQIAASMSVLRAGGLVEVLRAYVLSVLDRIVRDEVAPRFWSLLDKNNGRLGHQHQHQQLQQQQEQGADRERNDGEEENGERDDADEENEEAEGQGGEAAAAAAAAAAATAGSTAKARRDSYARVKSALLYVAGEVNTHLSLVRLLNHIDNDDGGNTFSSTHNVQARYRCAFTAQVMAGARGDFHGTMRAFFDRNLRFWHRSWLEERRRRRRSATEGQGEGEGEDGMDVCDDSGSGGGVDEDDGGTDAPSAATELEEEEEEDDEKMGQEEEGERAVQEEEEGEGEGEGEEEEDVGVEEDSEFGEEEEGEEEEEEEEEDDDDDDDFEDMSREELSELWGVLRRLGWFSLLQDAFSTVMFSNVLAYVRRRCDGVYDVPVLQHLMKWKNQVLLRWIALLLNDTADAPRSGTVAGDEGGWGLMSSSSTSKGGPSVSGHAAGAGGTGTHGDDNAAYGWEQRLGLAVHEAFCSARIAELFDIIADYPDSAVAIGELKTALGVTQQHRRLAVLLRESVRRRLLHPGANTHQIIDVYIATIKVLRILDPKDVLLETVAGPVRLYLQGRKDTVRCIVASLTDETSGDLYEELRRQDARPLDRDDASDEDDAGPVAPDWSPASRDADPASGNRGGGDILSMLVSIYGSKELFVTEYRLMLADKLVNNLNYDTDKEVQNLELLKLRFGESSMHHCEIMVRDVEESKRVNANVQERMAQRRVGEVQKEDARCLDAVMVSQHFWPHLLGEDMRLHPAMQERLEDFSKAYSVVKNPRLLVWKKQLGVVQLGLEFNGVERTFSVSPLHATLIMHFEGKNETWRLADLAREVDLPPAVVQKRMMLWVNQGVVSESSPGPVYRLVKDQTQNRPGGEGIDAMAMEDNTEAAVSADANDAEADKVIEQFLTGMLTNLTKLPLDRVHNNLKMFMSGGDNKYDKSLPELQQLLWRLCSDGKLEQVDGEYRLVK